MYSVPNDKKTTWYYRVIRWLVWVFSPKYRLEGTDEEALNDVGYYEYAGGDGICAIEWSEYIEDYLPKDCYRVKITLGDGDERARRIEISRAGGA